MLNTQNILARLAAADRAHQKEAGGALLLRGVKYGCGAVLSAFVLDPRFAKDAALISHNPLLVVNGLLQVADNVIHLKGDRFTPLDAEVGAEHVQRHDFR